MNTNVIAGSSHAACWTIFSRQAHRRALVGTWGLCCLTFVGFATFGVLGIAWFVLIGLTLIADTLLFTSTRRITDRPTAALDERQETMRNRAYRSAYLLVFYSILIIVGGAMLLYFTEHEVVSTWMAHPERHPAVISGLGIATLQVASLLPTALFAWSEADEPAEHD